MQHGLRVLANFGKEGLGCRHRRIQRAEEVIMRHIRPQPTPKLPLHVELGCIAGQRHEHKLRPLFEPGQRAFRPVDAGPIDNQKDQIRRWIGGEDLLIDKLLEFGAALMGT